MKRFNIAGTCFPEDHYMVDIGNKLNEILSMVRHGDYFTMNRARQYGKTTTLEMLKRVLSDEYVVVKISFENTSETAFDNQEEFCSSFLGLIQDALGYMDNPQEYVDAWFDKSVTDFKRLDKHITKMCKDRKVVLMIDEVDKSSNYRSYAHFLGMLRDKFLSRKDAVTFYSVILAGVYDIKNIKLKMINEGTYTLTATEGKIYNSPWNIAVDFLVDMSFNPAEIATMLVDYENDHHTGMDIQELSQELYDFTGGYPFLVSKICKIIDERLDKNWTLEGIQDSIATIIKEKNTLFDDLGKNLENNQQIYDLIYDVLVKGESPVFNRLNPTIERGAMFGIIKSREGKVVIANRIFEIVITEYLLSKDELRKADKAITGVIRYDVIKGGKFDMALCLQKFAEHYGQIFTEKDAAFLERNARLIFITYLRPLINGEGFYHMESMLSDDRRMDLVIDFAGQQFIVELKVWHGEAYKQHGLEQLAGYLDSKAADTGYLLTFDFKKQSGHCGQAKWTHAQGKKIFDVIV